MSATATMEDYPRLAAVLELEMDNAKRKRCLAAVASFLDEDYAPSLREIADRAGLADWQQARALVRKLEGAALLAVEWVRPCDRRPRGERQPRNRYAVLLLQ